MQSDKSLPKSGRETYLDSLGLLHGQASCFYLPAAVKLRGTNL